MSNINLGETYFERVHGYVSDLKVDSRWILKRTNDSASVGSLRIVSHPDLRPGYLRAHFSYITNIEKKTEHEIYKTIEDLHIELEDIETIDLNNNFTTDMITIEKTYRELTDLFNVKIIE